jgi:hypothetical protein
MIEMAKTITPAEFALEVGSDAKTVRKFLRSDAGLNSRVGKGHRWAIEARMVRSLKSKFTKWDETRRNAAEDAETPEDEVITDETLDD